MLKEELLSPPYDHVCSDIYMYVKHKKNIVLNGLFFFAPLHCSVVPFSFFVFTIIPWNQTLPGLPALLQMFLRMTLSSLLMKKYDSIIKRYGDSLKIPYGAVMNYEEARQYIKTGNHVQIVYMVEPDNPAPDDLPESTFHIYPSDE